MKSHQLLLIIAIALPWVGCKTISTTTTLPNGETTTEIHAEKMKAVKAAAKPRRGVPENIVPVWQNASLTLSKQVPTRGFAGRIYFHDHQENPLIVDGELIVYGFNEGRLKKHGKPEKRFVFSSEELAKYLRMSTAGASYNIWLPWDELGGVEKKVSLIAFFKDASGKVVQGSSINAVLPGTKDQLEEGAKSLVDEVWEKEAAKRNTKKVGFEQQIASKSRNNKYQSNQQTVPCVSIIYQKET